jgi:HSP20 family protein
LRTKNKLIYKINGGSKMAIIRFNPVRDLINVEREFNRMFRTFENRFGVSKNDDSENGYENAVWMPLTDIYETKDGYTIKADLPGMKKDDVKISYTDGQLSISGERVQEQETKDAKCHRVERTYGKLYRSFNLPNEIKEDKIKAEFKDGQLTITIPKADEVKPKEIDIKVN